MLYTFTIYKDVKRGDKQVQLVLTSLREERKNDIILTTLTN
jgi:hypothetical protein